MENIIIYVKIDNIQEVNLSQIIIIFLQMLRLHITRNTTAPFKKITVNYPHWNIFECE